MRTRAGDGQWGVRRFGTRGGGLADVYVRNAASRSYTSPSPRGRDESRARTTEGIKKKKMTEAKERGQVFRRSILGKWRMWFESEPIQMLVSWFFLILKAENGSELRPWLKKVVWNRGQRQKRVLARLLARDHIGACHQSVPRPTHHCRRAGKRVPEGGVSRFPASFPPPRAGTLEPGARHTRARQP